MQEGNFYENIFSSSGTPDNEDRCIVQIG